MFCLRQELATKIKQAFKKGELNPDKLSDMTSADRRNILAKVVGEENAKQVNLLFEKKLLFKNQEKAMIDWAKEITGMSKEAKGATAEKIRQAFADKKRRLYEPSENENFLNEITSDVYSKKYRTEVSLEEAQMITELSRDVNIYKEKLGDVSKWKTEEFKFTGDKKDAIDFGARKVALDNYVGDLKLEAKKMHLINPLKQKGVSEKYNAIMNNGGVASNFIADNSRSIVASYDNSFFGRQGIKVLLNPRYTKIWAKDFMKSWDDIAKTLKGGNKAGDAIIDGTKAEIFSRENYMKGRYERGKKLDIGTGEEAFPTSLPSKIPAIGRGFRASEVSYEAGAMRLRADVADKAYSMAEKNGIDLTDKFEVGEINRIVNSITGRGSLPVGEATQKTINKAFFSIKLFKGNVDFLLDWANTKRSPFARKLAAQNLLSVIASTAIILKIAQTLNPDDNKDIFNPTSSNFGKIRIGKAMTIDITGGVGGIVIAASKIITQSSTSATTGITKKLGEGYGSQTGMDVIWNFTENKFSPMFSVLRDIIKQKDFQGKRPTAISELKNLTTPIIIENISQFKDETGVNQLIGLIADGLGLNTNVYVYSTDWGESTGKELQQFKEKVGDTKFKEANDKYNQTYNDWLNSMKTNKLFQNLSDGDKQRTITKKKSEIKDKIFKEYKFYYKAQKLKKLPNF